jgi:hypothetical protein
VTDSYRPAFLVTIDTEEDNWFPSREGITAENIRGVERLQGIFDRYGVRPTYLTTWEIATRPWAIDLLTGIERDGRAEVGAHLHPWNTPPHEEPFSDRTTGWKNLDPGLQRRKLATLTERLAAARGGMRPTSFRAGRWSIGREGLRALIAEGYETDSSVLPYTYWFDVKDSPAFMRAPERPWFQDGEHDPEAPLPAGPLVQVPATVGFTRGSWRAWGPVDHLLNAKGFRLVHVIGLLARLNLIEKLALSPEINGLREMRRLTDVALARGLPVLNLFFHSGSLVPGKSPYVRAPSELEAFLGSIERYLDWLGTRTAFEPLTLTEAGRRVRAAAVSPAVA